MGKWNFCDNGKFKLNLNFKIQMYKVALHVSIYVHVSQRNSHIICKLFDVCVRFGRILHGAVFFDRERLYGPTPLT